MRRLLSCLLLTGIFLAGVVTVSAADAGSASDPLASRSYADSWADSLVASSFSTAQADLNRVYIAAKNHLASSPPEAQGSTAVPYSSGDIISLSSGSSVTVLSGVARIAISSGTVVNATVGAAASNGRLNINHLYICCDNTAATVSAGSDGSILVDGAYTRISAPVSFSDVSASDWFYQDVYKAVESGLIDGVSSTSFSPNTNLTLAQAIKLAACMHQLHKDGSVTLESSSLPWYGPYVTYAVSEGIIEESYAKLTEERYNAGITRAEYVHIFYKALPESEYAEINSVADNAIPDVASTHAWAKEIYGFYRAGILSGYEGGYFKPTTAIARREVAAVLTRMLDDTARQYFTLP